MDKNIQINSVRYGMYYKFLLDHPEVRQLSRWSDVDLTRDVDDWIAIANLMTPSRILDLGCGFGQYTIELARRGHAVTGLEYVKWEVDTAKQLAHQAGVDVTWVCDRFPCHVGVAFDLVCVTNNLSFWNDADQMSGEVLSRLRSGGVIIVGGTDPNNFFPHGQAVGQWEIWEHGTIVDTQRGTGIRLPDHAYTERDIRATYTTLHHIFSGLGCAVFERGEWFVVRRDAE